MEASIWSGTVADLRDRAAATEPVPAGVVLSAVTASLALALLVKVLAIARMKKGLTGERQRLTELLDAARAESSRLTSLADEDVQAFNHYLESKGQATRKAIEIPIEAARSAVRGLGLCREAAAIISGLTASDVGAASNLLTGAAQAMLISVDFNLKEMTADEEFSSAMKAERAELAHETQRHADAVNAALDALLV
jgi:formiminotetrahydrofolate cyclodeaminase